MYFGISPWTAYTAKVAVALLIVMALLAILFAAAFFLFNLTLMSRRHRDEHGGQEPSDIGFLQRERFPGAQSHREYLPAEEGPDEYWFPGQSSRVGDEHALHEEDMPSDAPSDVAEWVREGARSRRREHQAGPGARQGEQKKKGA